jgi:hypothetical protein
MELLLLLILHKAEFDNLYSSPSVIQVIRSRRMRWAGHVAHVGQRRGAWVLLGRPEGKGPFGGPRYRQNDNIKMNL